MDKSRALVQSLDRAMAILHAFDSVTSEIGVSDMARTLGIHESTASRLAGTLASWGMLRKNADSGRYQLGVGLLALASLAVEGLEVRTVARPHLLRLRDVTGETAMVASWEVDEAINIDQAPTHHAITHAGPVGKRNPAHCTAVGKAILAHLPPPEANSIIRKGLARFTPQTIVDEAALERELETVRAQGFAVSNEEWETGLVGVGAPVFDHMGRADAALCITGPAFRMTRDKLPEFGVQLRRAAGEVSREMGYIPRR